ncbi:cell division protein Cdc14 [Scheffersomyces coipomensis]|uniref:cell division protein Cdc14 n=1 Tax=Scheffersomyces coipomensis TaxID=1788519 RepID=UPI00315CDF2A
MSSESIIEIIESLDSNKVEEVSFGINNLDYLLGQLLPEIVSHYETSTTLKLQSNRVSNTSQQLNKSSFISLQDNFQFNLASHLINYYKIINEDNSKIDVATALLCNRLLQGLLIIHPNSRMLFHRPSNMKLILQLLETSDITFSISLISTLIHILLKDFKNFRVFESCNGCSVIIKRFKLSSFDINKKQQTTTKHKVDTQQDLNFKIIEFLLFYFIDETKINPQDYKTLDQKSNFFRIDFPDIDNLIESLNELNDLQ